MWLEAVVAESPSSMADKLFCPQIPWRTTQSAAVCPRPPETWYCSGPGQAIPVFSVGITKKEEHLFGEKWSKVARLLQGPTAISGPLEWLGLGLTGS